MHDITIWQWIQSYAPEIQRRSRGQLKPKGCDLAHGRTFVRIADRWRYLFRAVDSNGQTVDFYLSETRDRKAAFRLSTALARDFDHVSRSHAKLRSRRIIPEYEFTIDTNAEPPEDSPALGPLHRSRFWRIFLSRERVPITRST